MPLMPTAPATLTPPEMKKATAPVSAMLSTQKRSPLLLVLAVLLLVGLIAGAFYLSFAKSAILTEQKQLDEEVAVLHTQLTALQSQKVEAAQSVKQWLDDISKNEVRWSKVINSVKDLVPADTLTQQPKVHFLSYSGAADGKLNLNAETNASSLDPFGDVSQLVNVFNTSAFFKDAYVPAITRGTTEQGQVVLSFVFSVSYSEEIPSALTPASVTPVPVDSSSSQESSMQPGTQETPVGPKVKVVRPQ